MSDSNTDTITTESTDTDDDLTGLDETRWEPDGDAVTLYHLQRHRNGDETAVLLLALGEGFQALAVDVDAGGQILDTEQVGTAQDQRKAEGMCEYWVQQHPDGVLGGGDEDGGLLQRLMGGGA